jgi:hypothetical protein
MATKMTRRKPDATTKKEFREYTKLMAASTRWVTALGTHPTAENGNYIIGRDEVEKSCDLIEGAKMFAEALAAITESRTSEERQRVVDCMIDVYRPMWLGDT